MVNNQLQSITGWFTMIYHQLQSLRADLQGLTMNYRMVYNDLQSITRWFTMIYNGLKDN
jgi:hypothetical protein